MNIIPECLVYVLKIFYVITQRLKAETFSPVYHGLHVNAYRIISAALFF